MSGSSRRLETVKAQDTARRGARASSTRGGRAPRRSAPDARASCPRASCATGRGGSGRTPSPSGSPARATSAASCSGPDGSRCDVPATSRTASSARSISVSSNRIGSMFQIRSHSTVMFSSAANRSAASRASSSRRASDVGVEVALVEQLLRRLDDRRDDARPADDAARRAHRAVPHLARDVADRERELGRAGERVAPRVHRRRAGVRRLAAPREPRPLDAEGAEHDSERQAQRLEHRPLLDVQLEIRRRIRQLRTRAPSAPSSVDAERPDGLRQRDPVAILQRRELVLVAPSTRRPPTSRTASGRSAHPPRRPS